MWELLITMCDKDVLWLDVSVDDAEFVQVMKTLGKLVEVARNILLDFQLERRELLLSLIVISGPIRFPNFEQACLAEFNGNIQEVVVLLLTIVANDVLVIIALLQE